MLTIQSLEEGVPENVQLNSNVVRQDPPPLSDPFDQVNKKAKTPISTISHVSNAVFKMNDLYTKLHPSQIDYNVKLDVFTLTIGNFTLYIGKSYNLPERIRRFAKPGFLDLVYKSLGMKDPKSTPPLEEESSSDRILLVMYRNDELKIEIPISHVKFNVIDFDNSKTALEIGSTLFSKPNIAMSVGKAIMMSMREDCIGSSPGASYSDTKKLVERGLLLPTELYFDIKPGSIPGTRGETAEMTSFFSINEFVKMLKIPKEGNPDELIDDYNLSSEQRKQLDYIVEQFGKINLDSETRTAITRSSPYLSRLFFLLGISMLLVSEPVEYVILNGKAGVAPETLEWLTIHTTRVKSAEIRVPDGDPAAQYFNNPLNKHLISPYYFLKSEALESSAKVLDNIVAGISDVLNQSPSETNAWIKGPFTNGKLNSLTRLISDIMRKLGKEAKVYSEA